MEDSLKVRERAASVGRSGQDETRIYDPRFIGAIDRCGFDADVELLLQRRQPENHAIEVCIFEADSHSVLAIRRLSSD